MISPYLQVVNKGMRGILKKGQVYTKKEIADKFIENFEGISLTRADGSIRGLYEVGILIRLKRNCYIIK